MNIDTIATNPISTTSFLPIAVLPNFLKRILRHSAYSVSSRLPDFAMVILSSPTGSGVAQKFIGRRDTRLRASRPRSPPGPSRRSKPIWQFRRAHLVEAPQFDDGE
jgi:hypothetical protein